MFTLPDNPYEALGVSKNAQIPEIRSAHRKLVLKCHPDKVTDPAQKAIKQEEFQRVQKAYELLSDESERQKYDDMVLANEMEKDNAERRRRDRDRDRDREQFTPGRTPPRHEAEYRSSPHFNVKIRADAGFNVRSADPPAFTKSSSFPSSKSPYTSTRTPPRSYEDDIHFSSGYDDLSRESRKSKKASAVYEKEIPVRHEEEKRRRRDEEWDRALEKSKRKELERKEMERKEQEKRDKERRKEDKKRLEKERKRESDEKLRSRHKTLHVEELDPETVSYTALPKVEKKVKSSSSRKHEVPIRETSRAPAASEREKKQYDNLEFAAQYLETSRSKAPPGFARAKTYHTTFNVRHVSPPPVAVPTPPPAAHNVAAPPPPPVYLDDDARRSSARSAGRRMSHDSPRPKGRSASSHKKSSSARDPNVVPEPIRPPSFKKSSTMPTQYTTPPSVPESPPRIHRAQTEHYSRPAPGIPSMTRAATWMPGEDDRDHARSRQTREFVDDDSEDDRRPRHSRRARSPDDIPSKPTRYTVESGRTVPVRSKTYHDEPISSRKSKSSYYMPEANVGRPMEHRPAMPSPHHSYGSAQYFDKVKTAKTYAPEEVAYSEVPHTPYRGDPVYGY